MKKGPYYGALSQTLISIFNEIFIIDLYTRVKNTAKIMSASQKLIFKSDQINEARKQIELDLPAIHQAQLRKEGQAFSGEEGEDLTGPLDADYEEQRQNLMEKVNAELEEYRKERMAQIELEIEEQQKHVEELKKENENVAFEIAQEAKEKAKKETAQARSEAEQMTERAKLEVERMLKETEMRVSEIEHEAYQKGYDAGREVGYKEGEAESRRLINRLGTIIGRAVEVREQLISSSEKQMVDMVLMIARKVIKDEIIERKEVVLNNIRESLKRVKDRGRIDIRVNFADLDLTAAHKDELIKMMESLRKVNIYEDSRIERGGCIIETDIGSIDARISTQFNQIEEAIRNAEPL